MIFHQFKQPVNYLDYINFQDTSRKKKRESILFLEHPPTITSGSSATPSNLLISEEILHEKGVGYYEIQRGGDFTGHELGQLVVYFHLNLNARNLSIGNFLREMQEILIQSIYKIWEIELILDKESPGLYLKSIPEWKIVSLGVYFKQFFTSFGFAMNLSNDCSVFQFINPCGMKSENMKSLVMIGADPSLRQNFIDLYSESWMELLSKKYPAPNSKSYRWL